MSLLDDSLNEYFVKGNTIFWGGSNFGIDVVLHHYNMSIINLFSNFDNKNAYYLSLFNIPSISEINEFAQGYKNSGDVNVSNSFLTLVAYGEEMNLFKGDYSENNKVSFNAISIDDLMVSWFEINKLMFSNSEVYDFLKNNILKSANEIKKELDVDCDSVAYKSRSLLLDSIKFISPKVHDSMFLKEFEIGLKNDICWNLVNSYSGAMSNRLSSDIDYLSKNNIILEEGFVDNLKFIKTYFDSFVDISCRCVYGINNFLNSSDDYFKSLVEPYYIKKKNLLNLFVNDL
ncbi:hypothetical protein K9L67_01280 [Candidatus Woesearchaeota archaeon]|nr:hypothetical protein [Candidatus Woesearchaeota archaeon]MCF7900836.1 hypothetical protein [Candidatus Woesearchaeota archaeon]MCF8013842.1 hypothetical protein [Candidatus Woesearchaeota archaeon]